MSALPIAKLASLLIKTLAKPMSKRIKHEFSRYDTTQSILIGLGQATHQLTSRMTIWSAGYKVRSIKALPEEEAMKSGAELVGEGFIFGVGGGLVIWEYNKSKEKEKKKETKLKLVEREKEEKRRLDLERLEGRLEELEKNIQSLLKMANGNHRIESSGNHDGNSDGGSKRDEPKKWWRLF